MEDLQKHGVIEPKQAPDLPADFKLLRFIKVSHKNPDESSLNLSPIKFSISCQQDPPDYQQRIDNALTKYLVKNLGKKYEKNYEISVIDFKDVISSKTIPEYEQARILK